MFVSGLAVARRLVFVVVSTFACAAATERLVVPSVTPNDHQMFPPVVRPVPVPLPLPQRMSAFGATPSVCGTVWQPAASGLLSTPTSNSACACAGRGAQTMPITTPVAIAPSDLFMILLSAGMVPLQKREFPLFQ